MKISFILIFLIVFSKNILALEKEIEFNLENIKNYKVLDIYLKKENQYFLLRRSYELNSQKHYLISNLDTLNSFIINERELNLYSNISKLQNTIFSKLQNQSLQNGYSLTNAGITNSFYEKDENYLTIDMCPSSKKGFEKSFFQKLKNKNISVAITYNWALKHQEEFKYLLNSNLNISWINHSKTHYYDFKEHDLSKNFMLKDLSKFEDEILDVEKFLILNNQVPSLFFRFPGLVSNKNLVEKLVNFYNLIPLGTNNWLVKKEGKIRNSEIILVHGNLNEHLGIEYINNELDKNSLNLKTIENAFLKN